MTESTKETRGLTTATTETQVPDGVPDRRLRVGIIIGSTRPGRKGEEIATWVHQHAEASRYHEAAGFEVVDLADHNLHHLDEKVPAVFGDYAHEHTLRWSTRVAELDAFVIVVPEYNHSFPGSLKTALDFLYAEWHHKAVGFVSYGLEGGSRAVEQLRTVAAELRLADVPTAVHLRLGKDLDGGRVVETDHLAGRMSALLDDVVTWGGLLRSHREAREAAKVQTAS